MKRILALMFMAVMAMGLWAQKDSFLPLFEDGKVWEFASWNDFRPNSLSFGVDSVCGDVEFKGRICKEIRSHSVNNPQVYSSTLVYEENGKSFYYDNYREEFMPLMDMSLKEGEQAVFNNIDGLFSEIWQVTDVETIELRGYERIKVCFSTDYWIEGIGGNVFLTRHDIASDGSRNEFVECRKEGEILCKREDLGYRPLGVKDVVVEEEVEGPIYDTMGRRVETTLPGRLYIRNGRKFIAKP